MTIKEVKQEIINHFNELQQNEETRRTDGYEIGDVDHIRLRELFCKCPSTIYMDHLTIKEASRQISTPEIAVQKIPNGEIKVKGAIVIFVQQFFPSRYELGEVHEIATSHEEELDSLRKRITELSGCQYVTLTLGEKWESYKLLNIPKMITFKPKIEKKKEESDSNEDSEDEIKRRIPRHMYQNPIYTVRRLQVRDGDIVYFWDNTEELKQLTNEETRSLTLKERGLKSRKNKYQDREESLHIKEKDVGIEDEE